MKRLLTILLSVLLLAGPQARAQMAVRVDTAAFRSSASFRPTQLIAPGALIVSGVGIHCFAHESIDGAVNRWAQESWRGDRPERNFDNYIQYLPIVMDLGLGLAGARAEHGLLDRVIEGSIGCLALGALSWGCKSIIDSPRPNGVDNRSFPSGHTDWVFIGAELVRMEYGWDWGIPAYLIATTVGVMRIYNNWHWLSDVLFGAGLGILTAHIGGWLLEPVKDWLHIPTYTWGSGRPAVQAAFAPRIDPLSGTFCPGLALNF